MRKTYMERDLSKSFFFNVIVFKNGWVRDCGTYSGGGVGFDGVSLGVGDEVVDDGDERWHVDDFFTVHRVGHPAWSLVAAVKMWVAFVLDNRK